MSLGRLTLYQRDYRRAVALLEESLIHSRALGEKVLMLIRDTLKLVPARYDVTRALTNVEASLREHGY